MTQTRSQGLLGNRDGRIRTGDPLNPMDATADVRVSNRMEDQGFSGI